MPRSVSDPQSALLRERSAIERRISELHACVREVDTLLTAITRLEARLPIGPEQALLKQDGRSGDEGRLPKGILRTAITETLRSHADGLHISRILEVLLNSGHAPRSTNPRGSVQTTLYAMRREGVVANLGLNTWKLAGRASGGRRK